MSDTELSVKLEGWIDDNAVWACLALHFLTTK